MAGKFQNLSRLVFSSLAGKLGHLPQPLGLRLEVEVLLAGENIPEAATLIAVGVGAQLGPYKIEASIGKGGMGEVFRAIDTLLGRKVAIVTSTIEFDARFEREARAISIHDGIAACPRNFMI